MLAEDLELWMILPSMRVRRVKGGKKRVFSSKIKNIFLYLRKLAPVTVMTIALPLSITPFSIYGQDLVDDSDVSQSEHNLTLDISSASLLNFIESQNEIKPGESFVDAQARQKAEEVRKEAERVAQQRATIAREGRDLKSAQPANLNVNLDNLYDRASEKYGVDKRILAAVHYVESGQSVYTAKRSVKGATGPMQFLPSTFRRHAVDGNGDGAKDIMNVEDAVFSAAAYLQACGYNGTPEGIRKSLFGYNHSSSYYRKVMEVARSLGFAS